MTNETVSPVAASPEAASPTIFFRCPPELESILPPPIPAVLGIPDWFKTMPAKAFSDVWQVEQMTVKKCPPFIDAMSFGFLIPLVTDLRVENETFTWQLDVPGGAVTSYSRSPLDFHDNNQVTGTPLFDEDRFIVKFNNFWAIETPPGYSLLVTHPVNRYDLPFTTLTGLVDTDRFKDSFINFPAQWRNPKFEGVLPRGTPIAQCVPVKRDLWNSQLGTLTGDAISHFQGATAGWAKGENVYRRQFRAPKR
jgi:hypothetical protein